MKNISVGTIVRTIMLVAVLINMILQAAGKSPLPIDEGKLTDFITLAVQGIIIVWSWWKNNSFSKHAITADTMMKKLKAGQGVE